jgi:ring-1,2-phenylacetyl-CoA epoxidase subunit PaaE
VTERPLEFHELVVTAVTPLTDDAVALSLDPGSAPAGVFDHLPGQHLTMRAMIDGEDVRRSYSICSPPGDGRLRVGVKRLPGGAFSTFAVTRLRAGDILEALPPVGDFTVDPDPADAAHRVAIVAGSGITPVLSQVATTLEISPSARWTVIFGNRDVSSIMFLDELEGLKDRFPSRLQIVHVLSREDTGLDLTTGRIDDDRIRRITSSLIDVAGVDGWYLCGPFEMVQTAKVTLHELGVAPGRVHEELFFAGPPNAVAPPPADAPGTVGLTVTVDGRSTSTRMRPQTSILEAALGVRPDLPFSCKGGLCASCKAHLVEGSVEMTKNWALVAEDLAQGFILTCQAHPTSERVVVDYDRR